MGGEKLLDGELMLTQAAGGDAVFDWDKAIQQMMPCGVKWVDIAGFVGKPAEGYNAWEIGSHGTFGKFGNTEEFLLKSGQ